VKPGTAIVLVASALMLACGGAAPEAQSTGEWRTFAGTWSAAGRRHTLRTEGERPAATLQLSGSVVLRSPAGLSGAFRGEALGFDDGRSISAGRAVWTDTRGDQVFSILKGEALLTGRRVLGTITGGTGRYAGAEGEYALTWQYVVETEEGDVQGRAVDLEGRWRPAAAQR
jgi:hypothetical protein